MGKIKISEIDRSYINNFLKYDDRKIDKDWIIGGSVANICILYISIYFLEYKLIWGVVFSIVNIGILLSLIHFLKKVEHSKKNLCLYHGIYTSLWSVSGSVLSYALLKKIVGRKIYWIIIVLITIIVVVAILTVHAYIKNISRNYYRNSKISPVNAAAIACGILLVRKLELNGYLLIGVCSGIFAIASAGNIYFLIRYYCYCLLERKDLA